MPRLSAEEALYSRHLPQAVDPLGRNKIEALFAELKQRMGLRRVRLHRLWNVSEQFLLTATAQNLKRLVRFLVQQKLSPALSGA